MVSEVVDLSWYEGMQVDDAIHQALDDVYATRPYNWSELEEEEEEEE